MSRGRSSPTRKATSSASSPQADPNPFHPLSTATSPGLCDARPSRRSRAHRGCVCRQDPPPRSSRRSHTTCPLMSWPTISAGWGSCTTRSWRGLLRLWSVPACRSLSCRSAKPSGPFILSVWRSQADSTPRRRLRLVAPSGWSGKQCGSLPHSPPAAHRRSGTRSGRSWARRLVSSSARLLDQLSLYAESRGDDRRARGPGRAYSRGSGASWTNRSGSSAARRHAQRRIRGPGRPGLARRSSLLGPQAL